jgi:hypothetical protein
VRYAKRRTREIETPGSSATERDLEKPAPIDAPTAAAAFNILLKRIRHSGLKALSNDGQGENWAEIETVVVRKKQ